MKFRFIPTTFVFLFLFLTWANLFSQEFWAFGEKYKAYIEPAKQPLKVKMQSVTSLKSGSFVMSVGGVAFLSVAQPDISIKDVNIKYEYINSNSDGSRLRLIFDLDTIYADLPDWQLIPIVKYADSDYNSCVSLFGPNTDDTKYDIVYHPAFENTLLGVRVLQADLALMDLTVHWQLPKYGSKMVLGRGELLSSSKGRQLRALKIQNILTKGDFQSWVLTDDQEKVIFNYKNNRIILTGTPYYYFWRIDRSEIMSKQMELISTYNSLLEEHNHKVELHNKGFDSYTTEINELKRKLRLVEIEMENLEPDVISITDVTNSLKTRYDLLLDFNPAVFSATKNIMQYSALFRYLKQKYPWEWKVFYSKCKSATIEPTIKTPTTLPR